MTIQSESPPRTRPNDGSPASSLFHELQWFRGTVDPEEFVVDYVEKAVEKMEADVKSRGLMTFLNSRERMREDVFRAVTDYVALVRKISEVTCRKASEQFEEDDVRIIQARTVFDFETWLARVMFVIDAAPEKILEFSELLNQIETTLLMGEGFVVELNYVNKRGSRLDSTTIRQDFPFVGKVATRPKCAQNCESCALA
jgi:hypothetical protein